MSNQAGSFLQGMAGGMGLGMQYKNMQQNQNNQQPINQASSQPDIKAQDQNLWSNIKNLISNQRETSDYVESQENKRDQQTAELKRMQERQEDRMMQASQQPSSTNTSSAGSFMTGMTGSMNPQGLQALFGGGSGASGASSGASAGGASGGSGGGMGLSSMFGGSSAGASSGAAGGSAASGGSSAAGGGSALASAGPWAALAAVIAVNEHNAKKGGYRDEDDKEYAKDLIGGKVLEQDLNQRWLPKAFGKNLENDKTGIGHEMKAGGEFLTGDFSNGFKALEDGTIGKIAKGIKKLF